jgi:hypothetical protein
MTRTIALVAACGIAASASAQAPVIDGMRDAAYGAPIVLQTVETGFGDNASELNGAYAKVSGGRLYLMFTGNIEKNFNKMNVFIDSVAGGENVLDGTAAYDFGDVSQNFGGMTFDSGFEADYHMFARSGGANLEVDFIDRLGGGVATINGNTGVGGPFVGTTSSGSILPGSLATGAGANALSSPLGFSYNDSNVAGIGGTAGVAADQAAAAAVDTGLEFSIALSDLGLDPNVMSMIKISAFVGNGDNNYNSNQFLGGLPVGTGNLGGDGTGGFIGNLSGVDLNNYAGNQFFVVKVPAPASAALLGLGAIAGVRRRR